ncbi:hypothetical protein [Mesorhizobium sp.]|uniref:hypothetical protein n=1 Tax=Mesorhizobium sp. TaxID=1871066 RepID=UPI0011FB5B7B|nr:hypothetical protein [Mesorhizobium sp.]TIL53973.1 MAG: hypothetical protein E5Y83_05715 [Mesorhizobium sp.]
MTRTLVWWSTGAASAIMARLALRQDPEAIIVRCETNNEDPDNYRFEADVMRWLNTSVTLLKSAEYDSVWDVWQKRAYIAGNDGAPCTVAMKVFQRLAFQRPDDIQLFGYTADRRDVERFQILRDTYFELNARAPLIEAGLTKSAVLAMVEHAGIALPRSYAMGFPNANCLGTGCGKASSPNYWSLYRFHFPALFERTAAYSRSIGARLTRLNGERAFIDEIPADWPMTEAIAPACDFLCHIAEQTLV